MSIKGQTLVAHLGNPLNTHNFIVRISDPDGNLSPIQVLVSATTFPTEKLQDFRLFFQGERVMFPSIPTNDGVWSARLPEGEFAKVRTALQNHMKLNYNQKTGKMTHWALRDKFRVEVAARGLRGDVDGSDVVFSTVLVGCYMNGANPVQLDNSNATASWYWDVQFSYDYIEDQEPTPLGEVER